MKTIIILLILACTLTSCRKTIKEYYTTGELKSKYQIKNGVEDGFYKEYYKNGKIKVEVNFKNGKANGSKKVYFENGKIDWETFYVDGKRNGIQKGYYKNNILKYSCPYKNDMQQGLAKNYYSNGKLESSCEYKNGKENGIFKQYSLSGKLIYYAERIDSVNYFYEEYNDEGKTTDYYRYAYFTPLNDTSIYLGDEIASKIKLFGPTKDRNIKIYFYALDKNNKVVFSDILPLKKGSNERTLYLTPDQSYYMYYQILDISKTAVVFETQKRKVTVIKRKK